MPPLLYDPPELTEDAARVDPPMSAWPGAMRTPQDVMATCGTPATGSGMGVATRRISGAGMSGRARPTGPPPVHTRDGGGGGGDAAAAVAPLKPRILYKREWEIDRQTIPL